MLIGNVIKENSPIFDKNDPFLMNIFKKEMENENIWNELEIQEEQVKSMVSNVIFEQLINEVIEIPSKQDFKGKYFFIFIK